MRLLPLDSPERLELGATWLKRDDIAPWVAFAPDPAKIGPRLLKVLLARHGHELRLYTEPEGKAPVGLVGLSDIDLDNGSANLWYALGERRWARQGLTTGAADRMLRFGFEQLELTTVSAWVVDGNVSSRILERLGFQRIGRRRRCHRIGDRLHDRILYDLLAEEHREARHAA